MPDLHNDNYCPPAGSRLIARLTVLLFALFMLCCGLCSAQDAANLNDHYWICEYNFETATSTRLFAVPALNSAGSVTYSADRRKIAFDGGVPGKHGTSTSHIFVCNPDGSDMQDLGPGTMPSWSPRGKRIVFSRHSPEHGVWTMNSDGSGVQLIDNRGWSAVWSPNGNMIAYRRRMGDADDFVIFNLVEDEFTRVLGAGDVSYLSLNWNFAWSPDSTQLCFKGSSQRPAEITVVEVSSPAQRQVIMRGEEATSDFTWLNNSAVITTLRSTSLKHTQLYKLNIVSPTPKAVPIEGQFSDRANSDPDVSRDGRTMLYVSRKPIQ